VVDVLRKPFAGLPSSLHGTESILVVDDESLVRNVCTAVLTSAGYRTFSAEGGQLAIQMIKAMPRPIHLALIDVRMPRLSGPDLIVELVDSLEPPHQDIRFVLMSGYSHPDLGKLAERRNIEYSFLEKPFTASVLLETVRRALDGVASPS
jgi:two-component system, cell cycle sensor histidine kinase and response regulator CckA